MALFPTNQRDQILTAIAVVSLALVVVYWNFVYNPKAADLRRLNMHVDSLDEANQKARAQVAKGTGRQIRDETADLKQNLDLMRTLVPAGNEVPALLEQVSTAARRAKLDIGGIEPEPVIEGEMFDTYRYRVKINGSYHEITQVLTNIASLNRIVTPMNLALSIPTSPVKAVPGKQVLASAFEIQTYVVRTAPPRPKPKVEKPAGVAP